MALKRTKVTGGDGDTTQATKKVLTLPLSEVLVRTTRATASSAEKQKAVVSQPPSKNGREVTQRNSNGRNPKKAAPRQQPAHSKAPINKAPSDVLKVFVFGNGECGELGLGPKIQESSKPRLNPFLDPDDENAFHAVQIACGGMHTIVLTIDNQLVTWGVNDDGALGRDTTWDGGLRDIDDDDSDDDEGMNPHESIPSAIPSTSFPPGTTFVQVAAGDSCSFGLTDNGNVYGWGTFIHDEGIRRFRYDDKNNVIEKQLTPILIPGLENIIQITCGINHALALDTKGRVWAWGCGQHNQLGRRLFGRHQDGLTPRIVEVCRHGAKHIASGDDYSFAIDKNDTVYAWGTNNFGQAGDPKSAGTDAAILPYPMKIPGLCGKGIVVLNGGSHHAAAVTADGECLTWGRIDGGQLGIDFTSEQLKDDALIRRDERGSPRICLRPTTVPNMRKAIFVGVGARHTVIIDDEGVGYATGVGNVGQLGIGTDDDADVPTRLKGLAIRAVHLNWAGGGGQNTIVAGPANVASKRSR
ncbi:Guanine nucleotide exchange factor SRM1 [Cladobotryum mycophilum]|uniref:Guanine nucleotide exchange factor SRM1 n=1 Tax=Cladobotryum mycophilum TaxID=491253 RepID=A0ABR0T023_9HYPO